MTRLEQVQERLMPLRLNLLNHAVYQEIDGLKSLRLFMEYHVFAVWDFMSLLKALQQRLCCVEVPWLPSGNPAATRFINEIVLAEESDGDGQDGFLSHFELYHQAMSRCGANTTIIDHFLDELRSGKTVPSALESVKAANSIRQFVNKTFDFIEKGNLCVIASAFTFGREDLLPEIFQRIVERTNTESGGELDDFRYYLQRHIGLDGDEHGPMAGKLIASLCGSEESRWRDAEHAAITALEARRNLWDGVCAALRLRKEKAI